MLQYIARRILLMIPTLIVISLLVYIIIDLPPGDCVTAQIDELLSRSGLRFSRPHARQEKHVLGRPHRAMKARLRRVRSVGRKRQLHAQWTGPPSSGVGGSGASVRPSS